MCHSTGCVNCPEDHHICPEICPSGKRCWSRTCPNTKHCTRNGCEGGVDPDLASREKCCELGGTTKNWKDTDRRLQEDWDEIKTLMHPQFGRTGAPAFLAGVIGSDSCGAWGYEMIKDATECREAATQLKISFNREDCFTDQSDVGCFRTNTAVSYNNCRNYGVDIHANRGPVCKPIADVQYFEITGDCEVTKSNNCVQSKGWPEDYGNDESCSINVLVGGSTDVSDPFDIEIGYDVLTIAGTNVRNSWHVPDTLDVGDAITWTSDGSATREGWQICIEKEAAVGQRSTPSKRIGKEKAVGDVCVESPTWTDMFGQSCEWYEEQIERCEVYGSVESDTDSVSHTYPAIENCCYCQPGPQGGPAAHDGNFCTWRTENSIHDSWAVNLGATDTIWKDCWFFEQKGGRCRTTWGEEPGRGGLTANEVCCVCRFGNVAQHWGKTVNDDGTPASAAEASVGDEQVLLMDPRDGRAAMETFTVEDFAVYGFAAIGFVATVGLVYRAACPKTEGSHAVIPSEEI